MTWEFTDLWNRMNQFGWIEASDEQMMLEIAPAFARAPSRGLGSFDSVLVVYTPFTSLRMTLFFDALSRETDH